MLPRRSSPSSSEIDLRWQLSKKLKPAHTQNFLHRLIYRARVPDCTSCSLKARCCPKTPSRKVVRSIFENARDVARDIAKTDRYQQSRKDRKKVEVLFAHMKRILKMNQLRLRGLTGAKDEFLLTATAQNLRRMAKYLSTGPPSPLAGVVP